MTRVSAWMTANARVLRTNATEAERKLWWLVRSYRPRFTRQFAIGPYIADIACREAKVIVKLDGSQHAGSAKDAERTAWLEALGWQVLRYWNNDVIENPDGVATAVLEAVAARLPNATHPRPLPSRGGEEAGAAFAADLLNIPT